MKAMPIAGPHRLEFEGGNQANAAEGRNLTGWLGQSAALVAAGHIPFQAAKKRQQCIRAIAGG
jgi:hypothetical protein